jgi:hypothetical protein
MLFVSCGQLPRLARAKNRSIKGCFPEGAQETHSGKPRQAGAWFSSLLVLAREGQSPSEQLAGFRVGAPCLESLVEIAGTIHRERRKESNEKRIGLHDLIVCGVESHVQSPSARTIGRLMIQPVMQQERRTSAMRCLQERKKGIPPLMRRRCPAGG